MGVEFHRRSPWARRNLLTAFQCSPGYGMPRSLEPIQTIGAPQCFIRVYKNSFSYCIINLNKQVKVSTPLNFSITLSLFPGDDSSPGTSCNHVSNSDNQILNSDWSVIVGIILNPPTVSDLLESFRIEVH